MKQCDRDDGQADEQHRPQTLLGEREEESSFGVGVERQAEMTAKQGDQTRGRSLGTSDVSLNGTTVRRGGS